MIDKCSILLAIICVLGCQGIINSPNETFELYDSSGKYISKLKFKWKGSKMIWMADSYFKKGIDIELIALDTNVNESYIFKKDIPIQINSSRDSLFKKIGIENYSIHSRKSIKQESTYEIVYSYIPINYFHDSIDVNDLIWTEKNSFCEEKYLINLNTKKIIYLSRKIGKIPHTIRMKFFRDRISQ